MLSLLREYTFKLFRRDHFQLLVGAVGRIFVAAPPPEFRHVAKAVALQMIVGNLRDQLRPQRFPCQIFASAPSALRAGHARCTSFRFRLSPVPPRMRGRGVFAPGREVFDKLAALFR